VKKCALILAALETVYGEPFPHLNLRQWSESIYAWLTQPILDPTRSGRVTMDYLMKLVTTGLEWSYAAGETDVTAETLQAAAELLTLRRDSIRMIDGAAPSVEVPPSASTEQGNESGTEPEHRGRPTNQQQTPTVSVKEQAQMHTSPKCTFSGVVSIELKHFTDSGVRLVECPECASTRTLSPRNGVLRFPSHDKRKTHTPTTSPRWAQVETAWNVVGRSS